ncbi:hypothetical protein EZV62_022023 [Acer yangbiense]|uniref:Uncharacterized protein n=1 Tax=Acer yangbiense TaxID=1000413 RepID=A0A5C7H799_9ROSI|nr:hypothetical protein EZV62_022023 [Acer yangbiense]
MSLKKRDLKLKKRNLKYRPKLLVDSLEPTLCLICTQVRDICKIILYNPHHLRSTNVMLPNIHISINGNMFFFIMGPLQLVSYPPIKMIGIRVGLSLPAAEILILGIPSFLGPVTAPGHIITFLLWIALR